MEWISFYYWFTIVQLLLSCQCYCTNNTYRYGQRHSCQLCPPQMATEYSTDQTQGKLHKLGHTLVRKIQINEHQLKWENIWISAISQDTNIINWLLLLPVEKSPYLLISINYSWTHWMGMNVRKTVEERQLTTGPASLHSWITSVLKPTGICMRIYLRQLLQVEDRDDLSFAKLSMV